MTFAIRALVLSLVAAVAAGDGAAQATAVRRDRFDWDADFPPAAGCTSTLALDRTPDERATTGALVVRVMTLDRPAPIGAAAVDTLSTGGTVTLAQATMKSVTDADGWLSLRDQPVGQRVLRVRRIGFRTRLDTVTVRAGAVDTLIVHLETVGSFVEHNCRPRRFRHAGEPACITDSAQAKDFIFLVRVLVAERRRERRLWWVRSRRVPEPVLVVDAPTCERAARLYAEGGPPHRVIVARAGGEYFFYDPFEPNRLGEWEELDVFDRHWRPLVGYAF